MESGKEPVGKVSVRNARAEIPHSYTKKKFVFRLTTELEAEYLFNATSPEMQRNWIESINNFSQPELLMDHHHHQQQQHENGNGERTTGSSNSIDTTKDSSDGGSVGGGGSRQHKKSSVFDKFLSRKVKQ